MTYSVVNLDILSDIYPDILSDMTSDILSGNYFTSSDPHYGIQGIYSDKKSSLPSSTVAVVCFLQLEERVLKKRWWLLKSRSSGQFYTRRGPKNGSARRPQFWSRATSLLKLTS